MLLNWMRGSAIVVGLCLCWTGSVHAQPTPPLPDQLPEKSVQLPKNPDQLPKNIVQTAVDAGSFQTLVAAIKEAGLAETLSGPGPFTVFAPTDSAFAALPEGTVESLLLPENKSKLVHLLAYHVVPGRVMASDFVKINALATEARSRVNISTQGDQVRIDDSNVVQADIVCSDGVIHVIDKVLTPVSESIAEVATNAGEFGTLLAAAEAAGLVDVFSAKGSLTLFAPTDEAFSALPKGTVAGLLKPENRSELIELLKYHVVSGRFYSDAALKLDSAPTAAGLSIQITPTEGGANINSARLVAADIDASNGVIHVIDRVLLPSDAPASRSGSIALLKPDAKTEEGSARMVLANAIKEGVPVYNTGDHDGCADIYMKALETVATMKDSGLSGHNHIEIKRTLEEASEMSSGADRAWALRHRIDKLIKKL